MSETKVSVTNDLYQQVKARVDDLHRTGGPAFPHIEQCGAVSYTSGGMSLRDYFAAKAMSGVIASFTPTNTIEQLAQVSYRVADAMIAARNARPEEKK